jgi:hypothetical protein
LKQTALPALWDTETIAKVRLADGSSFEAELGKIQNGLAAINRELLAMPHYSDMFAVQDPSDPVVEYPIGTPNGFEDATEYSIPDPKRGDTLGHTLPIKPRDRSLGWTYMYLMEARASKLQADVQSVIHDARKLWQVQLLTRFFSSTANTVGGTSSADVPFCDAGSAQSTYVPVPSPEGEEFTSSHEHFLDTTDSGITSNTIDQSCVEVAVEHLQEHGHEQPYDIVGSRTDVSGWSNATNVTGWKPIEWNDLMYHASAVERASATGIGQFYGFVETDYGLCRVWLTPRLPTMNFGVFKTYGPGDQRNSLRVRYSAEWGFGYNIIPGIFVNAPLDLVMVACKFGVGVGEDRTNGVCVDLGAATWAAPTIS